MVAQVFLSHFHIFGVQLKLIYQNHWQKDVGYINAKVKLAILDLSQENHNNSFFGVERDNSNVIY